MSIDSKIQEIEGLLGEVTVPRLRIFHDRIVPAHRLFTQCLVFLTNLDGDASDIELPWSFVNEHLGLKDISIWVDSLYITRNFKPGYEFLWSTDDFMARKHGRHVKDWIIFRTQNDRCKLCYPDRFTKTFNEEDIEIMLASLRQESSFGNIKFMAGYS